MFIRAETANFRASFSKDSIFPFYKKLMAVDKFGRTRESKKRPVVVERETTSSPIALHHINAHFLRSTKMRFGTLVPHPN